MNPFREHMGLILRLMIVKMPLVLLCAASLAGCTTNTAHPSGAGASTTIKVPRTGTAPPPTVTAGESLLVVQSIESAVRHTTPADVLQSSGLAPAKCTAWDRDPALAGAGFFEVHLIVPSDKAFVLRKALLRLNGVESVAEAGLGEFGRVQGKAPRAVRMTC
jgi:predicted small secreted protein